MEAVIKVLRPFKQAMVIDSGYNYSSASKVALMVKGFHLLCQTPDSRSMTESVNGPKELLAVQPRRCFFLPVLGFICYSTRWLFYPAIYEKNEQ